MNTGHLHNKQALQQKHILVVEDDIVIGKNIESFLKEENFFVTTAKDGISGERALQSGSYDCIILDINLPGKSGLDLCEIFREKDTQTPVLLLTAFDELEDKVEGYNRGADDYLTKPFYMKELSLRVHSLIKRSRQQQDNHTVQKLQSGQLSIHLQHKKVFKAGTKVNLTPREFQILKILAEAKGAPVSKQTLVKAIWGSIFEHNTNTIEVYINFLRNKIDKPFGTQTIKTRIGFGYYLDAEE